MMGRENCRVHRNVFRKAGKQRSSSHCIDRVTGVLGVAPDCQPPTAKPQIEVTTGAGRALSEPKVRPGQAATAVSVSVASEFIVINVPHGRQRGAPKTSSCRRCTAGRSPVGRIRPSRPRQMETSPVWCFWASADAR